MQNALRSPMVSVDSATAERIDQAMKHAGLIN
jgi:4-hydroxy-tetrahydrodipicolinate synthase